MRFTLPLLMLEIHGRYPRFGGALSYIQFVNEHLDSKAHGRRSRLSERWHERPNGGGGGKRCADSDEGK